MADKDLEKKHPSLSFPYIETANNQIIFEDLAIAQHLARQNMPSGLYGGSMFQEAQVDQWIAWALDLRDYTVRANAAIFEGSAGGFKDDSKAIKDLLRNLDRHLKGKQFLVGNQITLADIFVAHIINIPMSLYIDPGFRKSTPSLEAWYSAYIKNANVIAG